MNGYGIVMNAAAAPAAVAAVGQASSRQADGGTFAGTLLYVMGGGSNTGGTIAPASGLPVGLLGLTGLFAGNSAETDTSSEGLLKLLDDLVKQLANLEHGAELPADFQNKLAALLTLAQNLLNFTGTAETVTNDQQPAVGAPLDLDAWVPKGGQPLTAELHQVLKQLAEKVAQGEVPKAQFAALAEPAAQALSALRQSAGQQGTGGLADKLVPIAAESGENAAASRTAQVIAPAEQQAEAAATARVQTRQSPMYGQIWSFGGTSVASETETATASAAMPNAVASAESGASAAAGEPAPVWTLLKGGQQAAPVTGSAGTNPQVPVQVQIGQFAQEMGKYLVKQFMLSQGNGVSEAKISLQPEHLGHLDIKIVIQNGVLTAQFVAENGAAREMLENQLAQLRTALQGQGLQVDKMEVVQQQPSQTNASYMGNHAGQQGSGHNGGGAKKGNRGAYEDSAAFEAELDRSAFLREIGYGSALNVTA